MGLVGGGRENTVVFRGVPVSVSIGAIAGRSLGQTICCSGCRRTPAVLPPRSLSLMTVLLVNQNNNNDNVNNAHHDNNDNDADEDDSNKDEQCYDYDDGYSSNYIYS